MVEFALQDTPVVLGSIEFVKRILSTNQSSGIDEDILFTTWNALMFRPEVVPIEPYIELFTLCWCYVKCYVNKNTHVLPVSGIEYSW